MCRCLQLQFPPYSTTIRIWNQLPAAVVMSPSIEHEAFQSRLMSIPATQTSETFVLLLSYTPARFLSVCGTWIYRLLLIFMHICHARHYSTLRNVHHRKRRRSRVTVICYSVASVVVICLPVSLYGMYCGKTVYPRAKVTINSL